MREYEKLFKSATTQHIAFGDASVWYLYSQVAVKNILDYNPDVKFVVLVRNPIEMAVSLHSQLYYMAQENIHDFETAWQIQDRRSNGFDIPSMCEDAAFLQYGKTYSLGGQISRLYETAGKERVLLLLLDDFKKDPRIEYLKVLNFISVPDECRTDFPIANEAKKPRFFTVSLYMAKIAEIKQRLGINVGMGVLRSLGKMNKQTLGREPLRPEFRKELNDYFSSDVSVLASLINRDLSYWLG